MQKRIELERRGLPPSKVKELTLDNCRAATIDGLTDEYVNLEFLSLINCGLTTLKNFPNLPNLKKLDLSDNHLSDGLKVICDKAPHLTCLNLGGNYIKEYSAIQPLKNLKDLEILDMFNCDIQNNDDYKQKIFEMLPTLKYLDGFDKDDKEALDSDDNEDEIGDDDDGLDELDDEDDDDDDEEGDEDELDDEDIDGDESDSDDECVKGDTNNKGKKGTKRKLEGDEEDDDD